MALSAGAVAALLGYFRRFENSARYLGWAGPAGTVPVGLGRLELRLFHAPRAGPVSGTRTCRREPLEARGYPGQCAKNPPM